MKKLIMMSVFTLSSVVSNASNDYFNNQYSVKSESINQIGFCYEIIATTVYSSNYSITHSTSVTNYGEFNSTAAVEAYIANLKVLNPDSMHNGTGYKTLYSYSRTSFSKCLTIVGPLG